MGIYITENPINKFSPFRHAFLDNIAEIKTKKPNDTVKFAAVVQKFKVIHTKKDNSAMAFVTFDDGQEQIEAVVFPKAYTAFKNLLEENKGLFVEGKISVRDDVTSVLVDMLSETLPKNVSAYDFIIDIPEAHFCLHSYGIGPTFKSSSQWSPRPDHSA